MAARSDLDQAHVIDPCNIDSECEDPQDDIHELHASPKSTDTMVNTRALTQTSKFSSAPALLGLDASKPYKRIEPSCAPLHQCQPTAQPILSSWQSPTQVAPNLKPSKTNKATFKEDDIQRKRRRDAGLPNPARQNRYGKHPRYDSTPSQSNTSNESATKQRKRRVDAGHPRPKRTHKYRDLYGTMPDAATTTKTTQIGDTALDHSGQHILMMPTAPPISIDSSPPLPSFEPDQCGTFIATAQEYLPNNTSSSPLANKTSLTTRINPTPKQEENPSGTFSPSPTTSSEEPERLRVTKTPYKSLYHLESCPTVLYDRSSDRWFMMGELKKDDVLRVQRNPHLMSYSKHWKVGDMVMRDSKELEREKEAVERVIDVLRKTKKRKVEE